MFRSEISDKRNQEFFLQRNFPSTMWNPQYTACIPTELPNVVDFYSDFRPTSTELMLFLQNIPKRMNLALRASHLLRFVWTLRTQRYSAPLHATYVCSASSYLNSSLCISGPWNQVVVCSTSSTLEPTRTSLCVYIRINMYVCIYGVYAT